MAGMTAVKIVKKIAEDKPGSLITPYIAAAFAKKHGHTYAPSTLAAAMRENLAKHSPGVWSAVLQPRERAVQMGLFA